MPEPISMTVLTVVSLIVGILNGLISIARNLGWIDQAKKLEAFRDIAKDDPGAFIDLLDQNGFTPGSFLKSVSDVSSENIGSFMDTFDDFHM